MSKPKVAPSLVPFVLAKSRAGLSLRGIAAWLQSAHGVEITAEGVRGMLDRAKAQEAAAGPPHEPPARPRPKAPASAPVEPQSDVEILDEVLAELETDIERARAEGATSAVATLRRLHVEVIERRRKLMPPPPAAEVDAALVDAGARAADRLRRLVAAERAKGSP